MGEVVKRIIGDNRKDPGYERLTVEHNADGMVHVHLRNIRMDITSSAYNSLRKSISETWTKVKKRHGL